MIDEYSNYCVRIYKNIYEVIKNELADVILKHSKNTIDSITNKQLIEEEPLVTTGHLNLEDMFIKNSFNNDIS